jgi:cGMP-dependent protein kinase
MGAAASTNIGSLVPSEHDDIENQHDHFEEAGDSKEAHVIVRENSSMGGPAANSRSKPLRQRIFDKVSLDNLAGDAANTKNVVVDEATRELLSNAFSGFYFLQSNSSDSKTNEKLEIVMRAMEKEEIDENVRLITEGESGDRLYVVESGELEVTINGEVIRTLKRSNIVGELSLLYDAPRTATVRSITKVVVWSLKREVFKRIQAMSASAAYNERARWLINCPELAVLSAIDRSRLVGILKMHHFAEGEQLYKEGEMSHSIILVEKGTADFVMKTEPHDVVDMDNYLGITRPARRNSVNSVSERKSLSQNIVKEADGFHVCNVGVGCILGMGILRSKAGMEDPWEWATRGGHEGAISPYSVVAKSEMQCWTFDVDVFENLFGNVSKVLQPKKNTIERSGSVHRQSAEKKIEEKKFDYWKFKKLFLLGSGTFGIVTLAEYRDTNDSPPMLVALKSLSKQAVIETGQLRHVLDERRLLAAMDSNFILKVYGTTQTSDQLIMVTEPLDGGDLWSVIYEVPQYVESNGLPPGLARFYAASIILALSHIHEQGVAYRDLKPENVMLDSKGRLRMIDFGFAKKVPYSKVNPETGEEKIYHKTYTLCGTPGVFVLILMLLL